MALRPALPSRAHFDTIDAAVQQYRAFSLSARLGLVRNAAFLTSLDEDPPGD